MLSVAYYWSVANMGLFIMAGADFCMLWAWVAIAVTVGNPVASLNCYFLPNSPPSDTWLQGLYDKINQQGSTIPLDHWSGLTKANCFETKAIWGLSIALA
jgi:hypothetical protein